LKKPNKNGVFRFYDFSVSQGVLKCKSEFKNKNNDKNRAPKTHLTEPLNNAAHPLFRSSSPLEHLPDCHVFVFLGTKKRSPKPLVNFVKLGNRIIATQP